MAIERTTETIIDNILKNLGWIDDPKSLNRNVYKQEFKNKIMNKQKSGRPDFVLYDEKEVVAIIEAKRPNKNLKDALEQAGKYASLTKGCKIVFAFDGNILKSKFLPNELPISINDIEIDSFLNLETLKKFKNNNNLNTNILKISQSELIQMFKKIDSLLKNSGLEAGKERFTDLSTLIFLKISYDLGKTTEWDNFLNNKNAINYINNSIIPDLNNKWNDNSDNSDIFSKLSINQDYNENLKAILKLLNGINFAKIEIDVKGGAYEYFLSKYNAGAKDLAQYYTPRHLIKFMVKFLNPRIKDKIYDPFCGSGGMLVIAFKHIWNKINNEIPKSNKKELMKNLETNTIFGREFTRISSIAKMNMILIGDGHSNIKRGDTFANPRKELYNIVLTNIPFGTETENEYSELYGLNGKVKDKKFLGEPSALIHLVDSLVKQNGKAGIIVPTGVLYRVYKNDRKAREILINNGLRFIINLPSNIFQPYTASQTSILFLNNSKNNISKNFISFFDLKNDGYSLDIKRKKIEGYTDFDFLELNYKYENDENDKYKFIKYLKINKISENKFNLYYGDYENNSPKIGNYKNYIKLNDICNVFQGPAGTFMQQKKYTKSGDLKVYEQIHVIQKNWKIKNERYISCKYSQDMQKGKFEIQKNDIIISMSGTVGETHLWENETKGVISTALTIIRVGNNSKFIPKFIDIVISNKDNNEWIKSKIKGTANKGIRLGNVKNIWIPSISVKKQLKIIEEYEKINNKILELKREIQINQSLSTKIFNDENQKTQKLIKLIKI